MTRNWRSGPAFSLRLRTSVLAIVLIAAACNSSSPAPQPSLLITVTPSPAALKGDLPVWIETPSSNGQLYFAGGFLHFPGGAFQKDPRADMVFDDKVAGLRRTPDQPYLYAYGSPTTIVALTYDRAAGRWLPVSRAQVSDDGLRYAYVEYAVGSAPSTRIHVVDVRTGSDQVVYRDTNRPVFAVVGFVQQNIYLTACQPTESSGNCWGPLQRLDAATGNISTVNDRRGTWVISGRIAWMVTCWPAETPPQCFGTYDERGPNQLLRVVLATGSEEIWSRGSGIDLIGVDGDGAPIITSGDASTCGVFRAGAPEQMDPIYSLPINHTVGCGFRTATADAIGLWLQVEYEPPGTTAGIYLYTRASGVQKISDSLYVPVGSFE
jgi:hypothetical protein